MALLFVPIVAPRLEVRVGLLTFEDKLFQFDQKSLFPSDTAPLSRIAQVCQPPDEIAIAVLPFPKVLVSTGELWLVPPPFPSCPWLFDPQHDT